MRIASYITERGAARYAAELAKVWPSLTFTVVPHPYEFRWTVRATDERELKGGAYVLCRPRGGMTVRHALVTH